MENTNKNVEELFNPNLSQMYNDKFQELIFRMDNAYANYRVKVLKEEIETQKVSAESDVEELKYVASLRVLLDLIQQGWVMDIRAGALYLLFSSENSNNKDYIKYRLSFERNAQFEEKSIVQFIARMEKKRNFEGREISIKSLIGDSTALINKINNGEIIVSPYIQQVTNDKDIYTGYKLSDIWRYFRYTWSIPYKTMPGRNIYYLVRDEAQENHPVIGIFALGNSVLNLTVRDNDIGWTVDAVENSMARKQDVQKSNKQISQTEGKEVSAKIERFLESEEEYIRRTEEYANKLLIQLEANIKDALNDIYVKDLGYHRNTKHSDEEYIQSLRAQAEKLRLKNLNNTKNDNVTDWVAEAESELFKKKRLIELAKLLETRNVFQKYHASSAREQIDKMLKKDDGRKAISAALIANRKNKIGVLKIVKFNDGFRFSNPGSLKLPKEQIYKGGESKARNPHMQTMLRMVGFGDNAGSGFPDILKIWSDNGWEIPELMEDTILNQVTLILKYKTDEVGESIFLDAKMSEEDKKTERGLSEDEKTERRLSEDEKTERGLSEDLSEVMTASDYKKVEAIILYLEDNKYVTPQIAEKLTGKSAPTVRRYLKMLVETGYVKVDGSTSNIKYVI